MPIDVGGWRIRNEVLVRTMVKCRYKTVTNPIYFLPQGLPRGVRMDILFFAFFCVMTLVCDMLIDWITRLLIGLRRMVNLHNIVTYLTRFHTTFYNRMVNAWAQ